MSATKQITKIDSSQRLIDFLQKTNLHKKDFAEMIGVTLSYVYSLIDKSIPFSTRNTTLERIAVVMDVTPESFPEYTPSEEPKLIDEGIKFIKEKQKELGLTTVQILKKFPRAKRADIVDLLRGAKPLPLDWESLSYIAGVLELDNKTIYPYWQARLTQYLANGGLNPASNIGLINSMLDGAKKYLKA